jgi:hypothetical protein
MLLCRITLATVSAGMLTLSHVAVRAQPISVEAVLAQVGKYVGDFFPRFANVVAVESYEQRTTTQSSGSLTRPVLWQLSSDFMLVRYQLGGLNWIAFRDTGVVNGVALDRPPDRLVKLFTEPTLEATERAAVIAMESTRFQIPGGSFAVTNPLLVVALMQSHYQPRLRFTLEGEERIAGTRVRRLRFEERDQQPAEPGTRRGAGEWPPLFEEVGRVRGTAWLEPDGGRIVKTEARFGVSPNVATTVTMFAPDERLALTVPVEMRTSWMYKGRPVTGIAKYAKFRRFGVETETQVQPRAQP